MQIGNSQTWPEVPLGHIIASLEGGVSVKSADAPATNGQVGVLKVSAVADGSFRPRENKRVLEAEIARLQVSVRAGDLVISRANTPELVGACGLARHNYPSLFLPDKLWKVHLRDPNRDSIEWLNFVLCSPGVRAQLRARASGTGRAMKNISKPALLQLRVAHPNSDEQARIVWALNEYLQADALLRRIATRKQVVLSGLMRHLLTGQRRLRGFAKQRWKSVSFGDFLTESRVPGTHGRTARKLTVKLYGRGVIAKRETKTGSEETQYYRRSAGQFIYSKLDFLNGAFGIVPEALHGYESTLDLPAFDVAGTVDVRWLLAFCNRPGFYKKYAKFANGGRKARRVNPADFLRIVESVPSLDEQRAIADVLDTAQREIDLLTQLRDQIQQQKRGLMQKLLTGQIPVPKEAHA